MSALVLYGLASVVVLGGLVILGSYAMAWLAAGDRRGRVPDTIRAARRHQIRVVALAGLVAAATLAGLMSWWLAETPLWRLGTIPAIACTAALAVLTIGELTWPRPTGRTRSARLDTRSWHTVLDGAWSRAYAAGLAATLVLVAVCAAVAQPNGASIGWQTALRASSSGPFPGAYYGLPQAVALVVLTISALSCSWSAMHRPGLAQLPMDLDHRLRRASAGRAFRIALVGVGLTFTADLFLAGAATASAWDDGWQHLLGRGMQLLAPVILLALAVISLSSSGARRLLLTPSLVPGVGAADAEAGSAAHPSRSRA